MENVNTIVENFYTTGIEELKAKGVPSGNQAYADLTVEKDKYKQQGEAVKKPKESFVKLVNFIEEKYKCSGLCTKQIFYLTASIETGMPTQPCLKPFILDLSFLLYQIGATMISSAVFFLIMIFFVCPLCCKSEDTDTSTSI